MPARMTKRHREAHEALMDWADWWLSYASANHFQMGDWEQLCRLGCRVQTPPQALLPRIRMSNHRVIAVNGWWEIVNTTYKRRAYNEYLELKEKRFKLTPRQKSLLLDSVAEYLTGRAQSLHCQEHVSK